MKSVSAIADLRRCHVSTVRKAVKEGYLTAIFFAGLWVILEDDNLRQWVPRPHGRPRKTSADKLPVEVAV
jgi:hypothetical protein